MMTHLFSSTNFLLIHHLIEGGMYDDPTLLLHKFSSDASFKVVPYTTGR